MTTINKHEVLINAYITKLKAIQRSHKAKAIQRYHKAKAIQRSQSYSKTIQRYHKPILKLFKEIIKAIQEPPKTNPKLSQR